MAVAVGAAYAQTERPRPLPNLGQPAAAPTDFTLVLGEVAFDPLIGEPDLPPEWMQLPDDSDDLRLVQFSGPIQEAWVAGLDDAGLKIVQYIHPYTYIVWGEPEHLIDAGKIDGVRWTGGFAPAYRVQPQFRNLGPQVIDTRMLLFRGADCDAAVRALEGLGAVNTGRRILNDIFESATFTMPGNLFLAAAKVPGVYTVRPAPTDGGLRGEMTNQLNVGNYDGTNAAFPGYVSYLNSLSVSGAGVIIANVDGGIQDSHPDLVNRLIPCVGPPSGTNSCGGAASSGHGTHTAGIMAADGSSGVTANGGFLRGLGVAPGANLVEQRYSPLFTEAGGMLELMKQSYNNGAELSGNSWGPAGSPLGYDDDTMQCDIGVRDADPSAPGNQPFTFVLSFMNGNGGTSTQGTPDEAKNIFNIGSTKGQQSSGAQILAIDDLSSNTAHGPALDGRTIPHLVAPGCEVDSTYTGSGYDLLCGTSMASPHVSGAVALFIEKWRDMGLTPDPSPAIVKAAFLPVAHDLAGHLDADGGTLGHPFDNKQGWGRMNLDAVLNPPANSVIYADQPALLNATGEVWETTASPLNSSQPMKIMLVWTDAPGHGLGGSTPAWNNDLNLEVIGPAGTYRGNVFGGNGFSTTGGVADNKNNTEAVFLGPNPPASVTIRVVAANISSNGVPNVGDSTDQDFAIVVYNGATQPGFALQVTPQTETVCAPANGVYTVNVAQILGFSTPVDLSASGNPAGTTVNFSPNPVAPGGSSTMTISNTGAASPGTYNLVVTGTAGTLTRNANATLGLSTAQPGAVALTAPANGANAVSLTPSLQWSAATQATDYEVQIATDPGFASIVYTAIEPTTSHAVATALATDSQHYWRARGRNGCGNGAWSAVFTFRTLVTPPILLVDDDDNGPNVQAYYTDVLNALDLDYDVWNTNNSDNEPTANQLAPYRLVIWFTGDEWGGTCGPGGSGESALGAWLNSGGKCLFMSSQDYHYDRDFTPFMDNWLGLTVVNNDVGQTTVTGQNAFAGMGPYPLSYPFINYSDRVTADVASEVVFVGDKGNAAVGHVGPNYRTMFWGFPFEALPAANRAAMMQAVIDWCDVFAPCPADINGDDVVDVHDLLLMIGAWGPCAGCPSDLNDDNVVDVNDLLLLIGAWGSCG